MNELHLLDILAARHGCFISDLIFRLSCGGRPFWTCAGWMRNSYPLSQWQDTVRYLTGMNGILPA